jgi:hypothetical protein
MSYLGSTGPTPPQEQDTLCKGIVCKCGTCLLGIAFLTAHWPHGSACEPDRRQADACQIPPAVRHFDHTELQLVSNSSGGNQTVQMPMNSTSTTSVTAAVTGGDLARMLDAFKTGVLVYAPPASPVFYGSALVPSLVPITLTSSGSNFGPIPQYNVPTRSS